MKQYSLVKQVITFGMAIIMLVATLGVALDFHICQGKVKTIGVFEKANTCSSLANGVSCINYKENPKTNSVSKIPCCSSIQLFSSTILHRDVTQTLVFKTVKTILFLSPLMDAISLDNSCDILLSFVLPTPPLIEKDRSILFQSFII